MSEDTRHRILDAALTVLSRHGLARLAVEDVARVAGVSRQTVYRYVGSRDGLITATVLREEQVFLERMRAALVGHEDLRSRFEASIAEGLRAAREHPLLDRLLETEPEALLPFLVDGTGPVLSAAKTVLREEFAEWVPDLSGRELELKADAATRLVVSYAISPGTEEVDELAAVLADLLVRGVGGDTADQG